MRKLAFFLSFLLFSSQISASEMVFGFKNPAFSGEGYSTHMLTIEQEEFTATAPSAASGPWKPSQRGFN